MTEFHVYRVITLYDISIDTTLSLYFKVNWFQIHDNLGHTRSLEFNIEVCTSWDIPWLYSQGHMNEHTLLK